MWRKKTDHLTSVRKQKQKEKFWGPNISFRDTFAVNYFSSHLLMSLLPPNNVQVDSQLFSP